MRVGEGEHLTESGVRDELSDMDGRSFGWRPRVKFNECVSHGLFKLMVEIISVNTVNVLSSMLEFIQFRIYTFEHII